MNNAGAVRLGQRIGNRDGIRQRLPAAQPVARDELSERFSAHKFHRDEVDAILTAHFVNNHDVGMVQRGSRSSLLHKSLFPLRLAECIEPQDLQGHFAAEPDVSRLENLAHASRAKRRQYFVITETAARR